MGDYGFLTWKDYDLTSSNVPHTSLQLWCSVTNTDRPDNEHTRHIKTIINAGVRTMTTSWQSRIMDRFVICRAQREMCSEWEGKSFRHSSGLLWLGRYTHKVPPLQNLFPKTHKREDKIAPHWAVLAPWLPCRTPDHIILCSMERVKRTGFTWAVHLNVKSHHRAAFTPLPPKVIEFILQPKSTLPVYLGDHSLQWQHHNSNMAAWSLRKRKVQILAIWSQTFLAKPTTSSCRRTLTSFHSY